jgi:uncharacterized SAM-binding protein YcdF (DUF218 family)
LTPTQTRTHRPARKKPAPKRRRKRLSKWPVRLTIGGASVALGLFAWGAIARRLAPASNTAQTQFDAIIVLGYPTTSDGDPSARELSSVNEAVREYERGVAPRLIFTGAAVANQFVEAEVMAHAAEAQGIPSSAVLTETQARNTLENACYSVRIMQSHAWRSAEVIANPAHLARSSMIFAHMPLEWRMHAAPRMEPESSMDSATEAFWEDAKAAHYLLWERWTESCKP